MRKFYGLNRLWKRLTSSDRFFSYWMRSFKGTNSLDRHTGARILIKKLIQNGAIGLVSTHDLELGELAIEQPTVKNYHFQEQFNNNQLNFDYHLRPGISNTRNALYLMKAAGIIVDDGV